MPNEPRRSPLDGVSPGLLVAGVRAWLYLGIAACAIAALVALSAIAGLVVPLVIAAVIAMLFHPVVDWLAARRVPRQVGAIGVMLLLLAVLIGALWLTVDGIVGQSDQIVRLVYSGVAAAEQWASQLNVPAGVFNGMLTNALRAITPEKLALKNAPMPAATRGSALSVGLFLSAFLLYYLLSDWHGIIGWLARHVGLAPEVGERVLLNTTQAVRRYFYALTLSSIVVSVTIGGTMALLGLPLALTIGLVTMVTS